MVLGVVEKGWDKRGQSERASEKGVSLFEEDVLMSSDEDVPAPSPSPAVGVLQTVWFLPDYRGT
eukprot:scaffold103159_cov48-Phaeocystis_antarctica.AAC.1